jgi:hypothetical protein
METQFALLASIEAFGEGDSGTFVDFTDWRSNLRRVPTDLSAVLPYFVMKANRSALIVFACVVGMPWGKSL